MTILILGIILIIFVLTLLMFVLLHNLVKTVNEKSKNYFLEKAQEYDNLKNEEIINEKETDENKIVVIKEVDTENFNSNNMYNERIPDYQTNDFLNKYKEINNKFDFDYEEIIKKILIKYQNNNIDYYNLLLGIKNKMNFNKLFELYTSNKKVDEELNKILTPEEREVFKSIFQKANKELDNLIFILEDEINKYDPHFYIEVGSNKENFDYLSPFIKTIVNNNIYKGVIIKHKDKIFDYSLN